MRTFQQMADQAWERRRDLIVAKQDPDQAEFPATRREIWAMGKLPWRDTLQVTYGNRLYGLKLVLVDEAGNRVEPRWAPSIEELACKHSTG